MGVMEELATPKRDALLALATAVGNHYRATGDDGFTIQLYPNGRTVSVCAYYGPSHGVTVFVPITEAGWNAWVETQLEHEFNTVCLKQIEMERLCQRFIAAQVRGVINAYR